MSGKQVPLIEVARLRQERRQLRTENAILAAENQGLLVEKARLIAVLERQRGSDGAGTKDR
jgi:hypothetical protein